MADSPTYERSNRILARLDTGATRLLTPHLQPVNLPVLRQLERRDRRTDFVYFIDSGFASVVADGGSDRSVEVGLIGREGMTGLGIIMGSDRTPNDTYMQAAGSGRRIAVAKLQDAMEKSASLQKTFLQWCHTFVIQTGQTALTNARSKIEDRLARWLLMAHDRLDSDQIELTHEFLSTMLGVRRAGVTVAIRLLENRGLIQAKRRGIFVVDRAGLKQASNGGYGVAEAEYQRLLGQPRKEKGPA
jgi:CRP-like cAMP-binding protein